MSTFQHLIMYAFVSPDLLLKMEVFSQVILNLIICVFLLKGDIVRGLLEITYRA